jgi:hypothetical protein
MTFLVALMILMLSKYYHIIHEIFYWIINFFFVILVSNLLVTTTAKVTTTMAKTTAKANMEIHIRKFFLFILKYILILYFLEHIFSSYDDDYSYQNKPDYKKSVSNCFVNKIIHMFFL